jgi:LmbE family N-acetylglucosaminyl deacetylase
MYRSNWYQSPFDFHGNYYVDISEYWLKKEAAIGAHGSELERTGHIWLDYFRREAENTGIRTGVKYAERFEVVKMPG